MFVLFDNLLASLLLLVFSLLCLLKSNANCAKHDYPIYYAEDLCDSKIMLGSDPLNSSLIIKLLKHNSSTAGLSLIKIACKVTIESTTGGDHKVNINSKSMIDAYRSQHHLNSHNSIVITEYNDRRKVTIEFNGLGDDLQLIITTYREIGDDDDDDCPKHYFLCEPRKCIHDIYRCDSYINCQFDESQLSCSVELTPDNQTLLSIISGIVLSLLGTSCLLTSYIYIVYYKEREARLLDSKQLLYGTINTMSPRIQHSLKVYK
ncbi:uncharacterized protein LOC128956165 [Oppia nitens]|uniref:uncharacterized protein LOC128956165 n=1 Tax=Oppia nitens TaxID=1686743 RepID=UPI0023DA95C2|nr:uncharacterized protein LOC128956165 [Oppia nitens]